MCSRSSDSVVNFALVLQWNERGFRSVQVANVSFCICPLQEIQGELYEVDDKLLAHLDWLEGHPDTYTRTPTQCVLQNTQTPTDCEVYIVLDFNPRLLSLPMFGSYDDGLDKGSKYRPRDEREDDGFSLARDLKLQKEN